MTRLTPNFLRVFLRVGLTLGIFMVVSYFMQGYGKHDVRTTVQDFLGMSILLVVAPAFVWFSFVPRSLEFSEDEITISTLLAEYTYQWEDLYAYGPGRGVYKIQFSGDRQPYQIFAGAYPTSEWAKLIDFMKQQFPDRIASGFSIGPGMTPKGK